ncbi:MAG: amino acid permease [Chloroflexi bacterium]|nr:amino acid permease [Chloroflexota bacterium]
MQGRSRDEVIRQDIKDLHGLGYAQELFRTMGGFSNFAISFSIISILTGAVILYDYGLAFAGTAAMLIGWPLVTVFVLPIAATMAEIASAYPTAGGLYYWASKMKGVGWGWWTAWLNLLGQFAIVAGINFAAAFFVNQTIVEPLTSGGFTNTTQVLAFGDQIVVSGQLFTMAVLMLAQLVLNIVGINVVALLNQVSVWWHIVFVGLIAGAVLLFGTKSTEVDAGLTLFAVQPQDTALLGGWATSWPIDCHLTDAASCSFLLTYPPANELPLLLGVVPAAFLFSLLQANWTYTGYDASAHVAEETVGARISSAWGLFLSVAVSAVVGYIFLVALTLRLPDLTPLFGAPAVEDAALKSQFYFGDNAAVNYILTQNLGDTLGTLFGAAIAVAMTFCGLSSVASAGRMLYAFARDDGLPGSGWLKRISHRYRTPANSLIAMVVIAWLFTVAAFYVGTGVAVVIVTAISTIFLYAAYGVVIYLGATTTGWHEHRVWSLGRWSKPLAWVAIFWVIVLMILFSFPTSGNISWPFMLAFVVLLLIYYFGWARSRFKGPQIHGGEAQLTEIEREFEQAAEGIQGA